MHCEQEGHDSQNKTSQQKNKFKLKIARIKVKSSLATISNSQLYTMDNTSGVNDQDTVVSAYGQLWSSQGEIPASLTEKARSDLNEDADTRVSALCNLRSLITKHESDGKGKRISERFRDAPDKVLLKFLRARKYNTKKTYDLMKGYVSYRERYPELFKNLNLDAIENCLQHCYPGLLHTRDSEGHAILLYSIGTWTEHEYPFDVVMQGYIYLLELLMDNEENQINGLVLIKDFGSYSLRQAFSMRISKLKKLIDMLQGSFPARFQGIHVLHQPWYFTWVYNLVKPFLRAKLLKRVHIHGYDLTKFHEVFKKENLPENFEGNLPTYDPNLLVTALRHQAQSNSSG